MIEFIETQQELDHSHITPFTRGLDVIDNRFGKPDYGELIIFCGYPSCGKTEKIHRVARENAKNGVKVCFISLELTNEVMAKRYAQKKAGVSVVEYQDKTYNQQQRELLNKYYKEFINIPNLEVLSITNTITVDDLVRHRRELDEPDGLIREYCEKGYKMFIIDNLGKIGGPENENARFDEITSKLQSIKNELGINIILLHHLKKSYKKEDQYKPGGVGGIRGSQKIIDNATQVIEIWRTLDPEEDDPEEKSKVKLFQYKNTITGLNGYVEIYFNKGEYQEENPYAPKEPRKKMFGEKEEEEEYLF